MKRLPAGFWPLALLAAAFAAVFLCDQGYGEFRGSHHHDQVSRGNFSVAANLAAEHHFLGFYHRRLGRDGAMVYFAYNRFPILGHALIKLVGLPFPDSLSAQLAAARALMLTFFCGAALLGHLTLCRLTGQRWTAAAATLLAFSSLAALHFADMIAVDGVVDLFAVMLAAHGLAVFSTAQGAPAEERGRWPLRQLLLKIGAALLLGWHVFALLAPFLAISAGVAACRRDWPRLGTCVLVGAWAVGVGALVLAVNLVREQAGMGPMFEPWELPTARSALRRTDLATLFGTVDANRLVLPSFTEAAEEVLWRIGFAALPAVVSAPLAAREWWLLAGGLAAALGAGLLLRPRLRHRAVFAALALVGLSWSLAMRHAAFILGFYEMLFLVSAALVGFGLALHRLPQRFGPWVALAAAGVFWLSAFAAAPVADDARSRQARRAALAEIDRARGLAVDRTVYVGPRSVEARELAVSADLLLGAVLVTGQRWPLPNFLADPPPHLAELAIVGDAASAFACPSCLAPLAEASLTPRHKHVFLLPSGALADAVDAVLTRYETLAEGRRPLVRDAYDIHLLGAPPAALLYVGACPAGAQPKFFLHIHPARAAALTPFHRRYGFENRDFLHNPRWRRGGKCYAVRLLPSYDIALVYTGQFARSRLQGARNTWQVAFPVAPVDG